MSGALCDVGTVVGRPQTIKTKPVKAAGDVTFGFDRSS
jgi:hypothetical protein